MTRRSMKDRLRHAFAVEDPADFTPTEKERSAVEHICREVVRRRMTTPALMLLEMSRPLNYLGAQALHFFSPFASVLVDPGAWETFAAFLERRGSVEYLCREIERLERAASSEKSSDTPSETSSETHEASPEEES